MPRVNRVEKSRKDQGQCSKCSKPLPAGSAYLYWEFRYGGRRVRCLDCPPRRQDLTQSAFFQSLYDIEDAVQEIADWEDLEGVIGMIEELSDECQDSLDSMPQQLQEDSIPQRRIDALEDFKMEFENLSDPEDEDDLDWIDEAHDVGYQGE